VYKLFNYVNIVINFIVNKCMYNSIRYYEI